MAISSRHEQRKNIRTAVNNNGSKTDYHPTDNPRRRPSHPPTIHHASSTLVEALTNPDSEYNELARYLLLPSQRATDVSNNASTAKFTCCDNHDRQDSMRRYSSDAYALAVEPVEIRSERIIMLAEAYAM